MGLESLGILSGRCRGWHARPRYIAEEGTRAQAGPCADRCACACGSDRLGVGARLGFYLLAYVRVGNPRAAPMPCTLVEEYTLQ